MLRKVLFIAIGLLSSFCAFSQYQLDCQVRIDATTVDYTIKLSADASKTTMHVEGTDVTLLNIPDKGVYTVMEEQKMAMKMKQSMLDSLEACNCTFTKTGNKKVILGYETEEYIQKCTSPKGNSEVNIWIAPKLTLNPKLITPMKQYIASAATRPVGFPLLHEGKLSNGSKVRFEVKKIAPYVLKDSELSIPEDFMVMEY